MTVATGRLPQHGFLRSRDGTITTFDFPGAKGTAIAAINPEGAITGDEDGAGFVEASNGASATFAPPDAALTFVSGINPFGVIAGYYIDTSFLEHGFLRIPFPF